MRVRFVGRPHVVPAEILELDGHRAEARQALRAHRRARLPLACEQAGRKRCGRLELRPDQLTTRRPKPPVVCRGATKPLPLGALNNRSEAQTSELQSLMRISYAVF